MAGRDEHGKVSEYMLRILVFEREKATHVMRGLCLVRVIEVDHMLG
jgi:hypothetical protein